MWAEENESANTSCNITALVLLFHCTPKNKTPPIDSKLKLKHIKEILLLSSLTIRPIFKCNHTQFIMLHYALEELNLNCCLKSYVLQADNLYINRYQCFNPAHVLCETRRDWMTEEEMLIIWQWGCSLQSMSDAIRISTQGWQVIKQCHAIHVHGKRITFPRRCGQLWADLCSQISCAGGRC